MHYQVLGYVLISTMQQKAWVHDMHSELSVSSSGLGHSHTGAPVHDAAISNTCSMSVKRTVVDLRRAHLMPPGSDSVFIIVIIVSIIIVVVTIITIIIIECTLDAEAAVSGTAGDGGAHQ